MISKMNYLLLSTMVVAAIDSTLGGCCHCPCAKENVEEGGKDDFEDKIMSSSYDNEKKDDVKVQRNNDEFTKKNVDGSHQTMNTGNPKSIIYENDGNTKLDDSTVLNTNPVIGQNATDKYTNVKMGGTSGGGNLKNDGQKNDIKPKVEHNKQIQRILYTMSFLGTRCKGGCKDGEMVHLKVITVDNTNATQETGIDLQLCKQHNICHMCDSHGGQTRRPEFLIPCGHMFCSSHYIVDVARILCTECGITLCGCFSEEYDHQICMPTPRTVHYLCHKNSNLGKHIVYTEIRYCEKHNQMFTAYELDPKRKYKKTKKIYKKV